MVEAGFVTAASSATVVSKQQITSEISLTVSSSTMVLLPSIAGLTGGAGYASTTVNIVTNNKNGYTVNIQGTTTPGELGEMSGDTTAGYFGDYPATVPETWASSSANGVSRFGFGITNTSLSSANGASGYGTCAGFESCWSKLATTTAKAVVTTSTFTPYSGDNFQLKFHAQVPANSNPLVPQDWYTATTTLTAVVI